MLNFNELLNFDLLAKVKFVETEFGGRQAPTFDGYRGQFFWHINHNQTTDWDATYIFTSGQANPGEVTECKILLSENLKKVAQGNFKENDQFCIREGHRIVALGVILKSII